MDKSALQRITEALDFLRWFDSIFFAYNLALLALALLIPPVITSVYLWLMRGEKRRRLESEIPPALWQARGEGIRGLVALQFKWRVYFGSLALFMLVLLLGASIVLFLKPVMNLDGTPRIPGLDFGKGANILMLGPYAGRTPAESFGRLIVSLAAFQYGFLGAYTHHIGQLARSYFTLDLTPHTYVDATVRIATGSLVALVLSFFVFDVPASPAEKSLLPVASFFVGFFPSRGLLAIEKAATAGIALFQKSGHAEESLSKLPGMSYAHELRLGREGFDTIENLANGDALELAVRTGFSWGQLDQWIGQAWLASHLREGYEGFVQRTAITSRQELRTFRDRWAPGAPPERAAEFLAGGAVQPVAVQALLVLA